MQAKAGEQGELAGGSEAGDGGSREEADNRSVYVGQVRPQRDFVLRLSSAGCCCCLSTTSWTCMRSLRLVAALPWRTKMTGDGSHARLLPEEVRQQVFLTRLGVHGEDGYQVLH